MEARHCHLFEQDVPQSLLGNETVTKSNLNFAIEFWQPFIDISQNKICGPLFGVLIEISRAFQVR